MPEVPWSWSADQSVPGRVATSCSGNGSSAGSAAALRCGGFLDLRRDFGDLGLGSWLLFRLRLAGEVGIDVGEEDAVFAGEGLLQIGGIRLDGLLLLAVGSIAGCFVADRLDPAEQLARAHLGGGDFGIAHQLARVVGDLGFGEVARGGDDLELGGELGRVLVVDVPEHDAGTVDDAPDVLFRAGLGEGRGCCGEKQPNRRGKAQKAPLVPTDHAVHSAVDCWAPASRERAATARRQCGGSGMLCRDLRIRRRCGGSLNLVPASAAAQAATAPSPHPAARSRGIRASARAPSAPPVSRRRNRDSGRCRALRVSSSLRTPGNGRESGTTSMLSSAPSQSVPLAAEGKQNLQRALDAGEHAHPEIDHGNTRRAGFFCVLQDAVDQLAGDRHLMHERDGPSDADAARARGRAAASRSSLACPRPTWPRPAPPRSPD